MSRPRKRRRVGLMPRVTCFKPVGLAEQPPVEQISIDEMEALRLKDVEGLDQDSCASAMGVAQSTFQRILTGARRKLSRALWEGKAIRIEGGHYQLVPRQQRCGNCGHQWHHDQYPAREEHCPQCQGRGRRWRGKSKI